MSMSEYERGILMAMSVLMACHDQPAMAADVLKEFSLQNADCSELDDYDKRNLKKAQGELGGLIKLRGLRVSNKRREPNGDPRTIVPAPAPHKKRPELLP